MFYIRYLIFLLLFVCITAGVIGIPGGVVGTILSGWILKRFQLRTPSTLKFCAVTCAIVFVMNAIMLMHCEETAIAGVNAPYKYVGRF